jgi:hypothetical protein
VEKSHLAFVDQLSIAGPTLHPLFTLAISVKPNRLLGALERIKSSSP